MRRLFLTALIVITATIASAQTPPTFEHAEKVAIKPSTVGLNDTLVVFGGVKAGPNGTEQVVFGDGTLNVSTAIQDGSITFSKWDDNDCTLNQVPIFTGTDWVCGSAGAAGGLTADTDATITGDWRFTTNTTFGDAIAANQLLHLYRASATAGLRIQQSTDAWDILGAASLTFGKVSGNTALTLTNTGVGIFDTTPSYALDVTGDVRTTGTLRVGNYVGSSLIPETNDLYTLGSTNLKWMSADISTIYATIFAEETAQLFGGYQIIGKQIGTLDAAVSSAATTINFGETINETLPQWALIRAYDQAGNPRYEYITINSLASGTTYNVTRDVTNGSPTDPAWPDGTPFLVLGKLGDGRIELRANAIGAEQNSGLPTISVLRQGATANEATPLVRLGGLDGMPTMASYPGRYGLFLGESDTSYLKFQRQKEGVTPGEHDNKLVIKGEIWVMGGDAATTSYVNSGDAGRVPVGGAAADVNSGITKITGTQISTTNLAAINADLGTITAGTLNSVAVNSATITGSTLRTATNCGLVGGPSCVTINASGLFSYNASAPTTPQFSISTATGRATAGGGAVTLDADGITLTSPASASGSPQTTLKWTGGQEIRAFDGLSGTNAPGLVIQAYNGWGSSTGITLDSRTNTVASVNLNAYKSAGNSTNLFLTGGGGMMFYADSGGTYHAFFPQNDGGELLGSPTNRWGALHAVNANLSGTITTAPPTTTTIAAYPLVMESGQIKQKTSGVHQGGCGSPFTVERGLVVGCDTNPTPFAKIYTSTGNAVCGHNTNVAIGWDLELQDVTDMHSPVTNNSRVTFASAGVYSIVGQSIWAAGAGGSRKLWIRLNGQYDIGRDEYYAATGTPALTVQATSLHYMNQGDYIELVHYQNSGGDINCIWGYSSSQNSYLAVTKLH